jgi:hypothetical protein
LIIHIVATEHKQDGFVAAHSDFRFVEVEVWCYLDMLSLSRVVFFGCQLDVIFCDEQQSVIIRQHVLDVCMPKLFSWVPSCNVQMTSFWSFINVKTVQSKGYNHTSIVNISTMETLVKKVRTCLTYHLFGKHMYFYLRFDKCPLSCA